MKKKELISHLQFGHPEEPNLEHMMAKCVQIFFAHLHELRRETMSQ